MKVKFALFSTLIIIANTCLAQSFIPDQDGYVADPAFHKLIKTRGYQLVTSFDTLQKKPLRFVARVLQNGKWLFMDNTGKIITEQTPAFNTYAPNSNPVSSHDISISTYDPAIKPGYKLTQSNGKYGLATAGGKVILPPQYTQIKDCLGCNFRRNLVMIEKNGKWGIASVTGAVIVPPIYLNIRPITFQGHMMITTGQAQEERYGLIDSLGKILLPPIYTGMMEYLSDDKLIKIYNETENGARYGRASLQGKLLINPVYEQILPVSNGIIVVKQNNKTGAFSRSGKTILEPIYDQVFSTANLPYLLTGNKGKYGLFSISGTAILPIVYEELIPGRHGFLFKKDNTWGVMDVKGKLIKTLNYDRMEPKEQYLLVSQDNKWGVIDSKGDLVIPIKYDRFRNPHKLLRNGLAEVDQSRTDVTIDRYGNEYTRPN